MTKRPTKRTKKPSYRKSTAVARCMKDYKHVKEERVNLPTEELASIQNVKSDSQNKINNYVHQPHKDVHIDPYLSWAGKDEKQSIEIDSISIHEHERIEPAKIISTMMRNNRKIYEKETQPRLFDNEEYNLPMKKSLEFYKHKRQWCNRLITGDSLLVMNSLLSKESFGKRVQMVFMDPPYGIKYGSNFQPYVENPDPTNEDEITNEPEQIKAFRDTWEKGTHSYLTHLRDRLLLIREMLTDSGSCFVQIGKENVHRVALLMDEVFRAHNQVAMISFATRGISSSKTLSEVADYILWYAKDKRQVKFHQLYEKLDRTGIIEHFGWNAMVELPNKKTRKVKDKEKTDISKLPAGAKIYGRRPLFSQGGGRNFNYNFKGRVFRCPKNTHWSVDKNGLDRLAEMGRLDAQKGVEILAWKRYENEVPGKMIHNLWSKQLRALSKNYVVQTDYEVIKRCILMTTDPGDLVFDPTCGSGTTAYAAEKWGRRWVTTDTSRVAISLTRHRLITAVYDYFELIDEKVGVDGGFRYEKVPDVSPSVHAYNKPIKEIILYNQPKVKHRNKRTSGPFTVEAVPAPVVSPLDEINNSENIENNPATEILEMYKSWLEEIKIAGVRGKNKQVLQFDELKLHDGRFVHGWGMTNKKENVAISFGPLYSLMSSSQVNQAIDEVNSINPKPDKLLFAAYSFDNVAIKNIHESRSNVQILSIKMDSDLQTKDLKKKQKSTQSFWFVGKPEIKVNQYNDKFTVTLAGFDHYDIDSDTVISGNVDRVVMWMLDTNYDGKSLVANQIFFPMKNGKLNWKRLEKTIKAKLNNKEYINQGSASSPFTAGNFNRIAVKVITSDGIETMAVEPLPATNIVKPDGKRS